MKIKIVNLYGESLMEEKVEEIKTEIVVEFLNRALQNIDFSFIEIKTDLPFLKFENVRFQAASFYGKIRSCIFKNCSFNNCSFYTDFKGLNIFSNCSFIDATFPTPLANNRFSNCNFTRASISASVKNARFYNCNFSKACLLSPAEMLLARWEEFNLSPQLIADLMLYDSLNHPDPNTFDKWAKDSTCPYSKTHNYPIYYSRAAYFTERETLWGQGKFTSVYNLFERVLQETNPEWDEKKYESFMLALNKQVEAKISKEC